MAIKNFTIAAPQRRFYRRPGAELARQPLTEACLDKRSPAFNSAFRKYVTFHDAAALADCHPLLHRAVEVARSFENPYLTLTAAAEIAISHGEGFLPETTLAAMLISETSSSDLKHLSRLFQPPAVWVQIHRDLRALQQARRLPMALLGLKSRSSIIDYHALMRRILFRNYANIAGNPAYGLSQEPLLLAHLALELARAKDNNFPFMHDMLFGLAPLAERYGFSRMAGEFKNQALKSVFGLQERVELMAQRRLIRGHDLLTTENILANLRDSVCDALRQALPGKVKSVRARTKTTYSIWEKQKTKGAVSADLYAMEIIVADTETLWQAVKFIKAAAGLALPEERFLVDEFRPLSEAIQAGKEMIEEDNITTERPNGYSAYTLIRVFEIGRQGGYPVEIKITTPDRAERNESGKAAHWKYKTERSLKFLELEHDQDLSAKEPEPDEHLFLIGKGLSEKEVAHHQNPSFEIERHSKSLLRVSDLAEKLGVSLRRQKVHAHRGQVDHCFVSPVKSGRDLKLQDGMLFLRGADLRLLSLFRRLNDLFR